MKECNKCGLTKKFNEFAYSASTYDGHQRTCRACVSENGKARYLAEVALTKEMIATGMTKACYTCTKVKPLTAYSKAPKNKDGYMGICKVCSHEQFKRCKAERALRPPPQADEVIMFDFEKRYQYAMAVLPKDMPRYEANKLAIDYARNEPYEDEPSRN